MGWRAKTYVCVLHGKPGVGMPIIDLDPNDHVCAGQWLKIGLASIHIQTTKHDLNFD
jgi:hypothetical protein